jgi:hypothetical protein
MTGGPMSVRVVFDGGVHVLDGPGAEVELANRFLAHLSVRGFAAATRRAYAYDLLNFLRFLDEAGLGLVQVVPTDLFDYLEWQGRRPSTAGRKVVRLAEARGVAASTMNRRIAAVRGLFEYAVLAEVVERNPVPGRPAHDQPAGPSPGSAGACGLAGLVRAVSWCAPKRSPPRRCRRSSLIFGPAGTGRSCC